MRAKDVLGASGEQAAAEYLTSRGFRILDRNWRRGLISARGAVKVKRVAWTIADVAGKPRPTADECNAALGLRLGVRR